LRYKLDDLGWYGFERLMQSLLKAKIGIGVENWSGHSDLGRDAYCDGSLHFPEKEHLSPGPFVFQIKHVSGANAAGSRPLQALRAAVVAEARSIANRKTDGDWKDPGTYVLLTNVPVTRSQREMVRKILRTPCLNCRVSVLGGRDVSDLLDDAPEIRQAHPEILGLTDLFTLVRKAASAAILERSSSAIQEAESISKVFVATSTYHRAIEKLVRFHFVVLDGPPEMGKTAIARMIALCKVVEGWTAIECRHPNDIFAEYSKSAHQIFIADDAFGRTEFDIALGREWERDLGRVLLQTDRSHWLVWTSRKHVLARALASMDLGSAASDFPCSSDLTVDASDLTTQEKAWMLFRHAKRGGLNEESASLVRASAVQIVENRFFTPERIRRFVRESLPEIVTFRRGKATSLSGLSTLVDEAIQRPTRRMRKAFKGLPTEHRDLLIAMLECDRYCTADRSLEPFKRNHGTITQNAFRVTIDQLKGTFLKEARSGALDWIHPSYRDVVIDALSEDAELQIKFLRTASVRGMQLAFSTRGGEAGDRNFPFVRCSESWAVAGQRLADLVRDPTYPEVLEILRSALLAARELSAEIAQYAEKLAETMLDSLCRSFSSDRILHTREIEALYSIFSLQDLPSRFNYFPVDDLPPPNLQLRPYLRLRLQTVRRELEAGREFDSDLAHEIVALVNWVQRFEPRGLFDSTITDNLDPILEQMYEYANRKATFEFDDDADHYENMRECERLSAAFKSINYGDIERAEDMASILTDRWAEHYSEYEEEEEELIDVDEPPTSSVVKEFSISALFEDL